jgi:RNA polymerase sigma factor (TIGR02999 family)
VAIWVDRGVCEIDEAVPSWCAANSEYRAKVWPCGKITGVHQSAELIQLLEEWREGDTTAYDRLIPLVYDELRRLARSQLRREHPGHSLQATQLVHEAYLRLADADIDWRNRTHFLSVAARVMRRILVEHAREKRAQKRGGGFQVTLMTDVAATPADPVDVLALNAALERLSGFDARQAEVVELCYFGGLTYPEIGRLLDISEATVDRDLRHARAWLRREMRNASADIRSS